MEPFDVSPRDIDLRRDLLREGWRDRDIARAVQRGDLTKVRYGAYIRTPLLTELDDVGLARVRSRAVLRTATGAAVLTHQSALAEYGLPLWGMSLHSTHLTRTDGRAGRREAGVVQHRACLEPEEWAVRDAVAVVNLARAVLEVIVTHKSEVGLVAACMALKSGRTSMEELRAMEEVTERWPNSLNVRIVLARVDGRLSNVAEARVWHLFHEQRLPVPEPQVEVVDEFGILLGIVDFLWREFGVFLEFDGKIKYDKFRKPGETLDQYLMREKRREEQICLATGWVCLRIQWSDLDSPVRLAKRILHVLASRPQSATVAPGVAPLGS